MITKDTKIDSIDVLENNSIQVREVTYLYEDGKVLTKTYARWVLSPGDDVSEQDAKVQAICNAVWAMSN